MQKLNHQTQQAREHQITQLLRWYRTHFPPTSFHGRLQLGYRGEYQPALLPLFTGEQPQVEQFLQQQFTPHRRCNYYITANKISGTQRNQSSLFSLDNLVIDIDQHEDSIPYHTPTQTRELCETLLWRFHHDAAEHIPPPTSIIFTGRGLQLWWHIEAIHKKCKTYYDEVRDSYLHYFQNLISSSSLEDFSSLSVDSMASSNGVGYFRLPETFNTKAAIPTEILEFNPENTYVLQDLVQLVKEYKRPLPKTTPIPLPSQDKQNFTQIELSILKNINTLAFFRTKQLISLRSLRNASIGAEERNNLSLILYSTLLPALGSELAWEKLCHFNQEFKEPMTLKELKNVIVSSKSKGGYKYSNKKIIEFLHITPEEQEKICLFSANTPFSPITPIADHPARRASSKLQKETRNTQILSLADQGNTIQSIAKTLAISEPTVAKVIKEHRGSPKDIRKNKAFSYAKQGKSPQEIASLMGCSSKTIQRILASVSSF